MYVLYITYDLHLYKQIQTLCSEALVGPYAFLIKVSNLFTNSLDFQIFFMKLNNLYTEVFTVHLEHITGAF